MNADRAFRVGMALAFVASALVVVCWSGSMAQMPGMTMPGGWTMSMTWMRMPGQGWLAHLGMFLGMWSVMMVAMMLPAVAPEIARFRRTHASNRVFATAAFVTGYFGVWTALGAALFPFGVAFAHLAMRSEAVARVTPMLGSVVVILAAALQFAPWKARQLAGCRHDDAGPRDLARRQDAPGALLAGGRLGIRCVYCCAGITAVLTVIDVMDLRAMALTTIAISAERRTRPSMRVPRLLGVAMLAVGVWLFMRALAAG